MHRVMTWYAQDMFLLNPAWWSREWGSTTSSLFRRTLLRLHQGWTATMLFPCSLNTDRDVYFGGSMMRYPSSIRSTLSFSPRSSWRAGKASPRMYRCPLLAPLQGCHLVLLLCHFLAVRLLSRFLLSWAQCRRPAAGWKSTGSFDVGVFRSS